MSLSNEEIIALGKRAEQLKNSPEFQAVIGAVQAEAFRDWHSSKSEEFDKRENSYHLMSATKKFVDNLEIMISNGSFAERKVEEAQAEAFRQGNEPDQGELI